MKKRKKQIKNEIPAYLNLETNLNAEIHAILSELKEHINTKEIDLDSATDFIKDHLNEVISDVLFNELNEELLVANVIAFKKVA